MAEVLYRYDWHMYDTEITFYLSEYRVIRETAASYLIDLGYGEPNKWVLKMAPHARKRFAYPTQELAFNSMVIRTAWRISYASAAHDKATRAQQMMKEHKEKILNGERTINIHIPKPSWGNQ